MPESTETFTGVVMRHRLHTIQHAWPSLVVLCTGAGCGEAIAPADRLSVRFESTHFAYETSAGDTVDTIWQEAFYSWVTDVLEIPFDQPLEYTKYRDADHLHRVTGHACCGFAENPPSYRFHTIDGRDNHEMIHTLVGNAWGQAPGLFNEGIVVAHHGNALPDVFVPGEPYWLGRPIDDVARDAARAGGVPPLDELLDSERFFQHTSNQVYPLAGSFVRFVADSVGLAPFHTYFAKSRPGDTPARTRELFAGAFGSTVDAWWEAWLATLHVAGRE